MAGVPQYPQVLTSQFKTGTSFASFTTAKSILVPEDLITLPANYEKIGTDLNIRVQGGISNIASAPGTITFQVMMGSIVAWTSGAIQLNATTHTTLPFWLDIDLRLDSSGSGTSAKMLGMGMLGGVMFTRTAAQVDDVNTPGLFMVPATAPAVGTGFDSTIANILDFYAGFSVSDPANLIQLYKYRVTQFIF